MPPRYQDIGAGQVALVSSPDGGALVRVIAGEVAGHGGPGVTHTPMAMAHVTVSPGARWCCPGHREYNALVYVLAGEGSVGSEGRPVRTGQLVVFGAGDTLDVSARDRQEHARTQLDVLVLGGRPIGEPVVDLRALRHEHAGRDRPGLEDFQHGKLGTIPAEEA